MVWTEINKRFEATNSWKIALNHLNQAQQDLTKTAKTEKPNEFKPAQVVLYSGAIWLQRKVKITKEGILIPEELFKEMLGTYVKMEQILETLETLADKKTLETIEKSKQQVAKGEYVECSFSDLEKVLK
jgi:hypothetical protein